MNKTILDSKENYFWVVLLFLINPFFSLILSLKNYFSTYSKNIVLLFCGFYGLTFYPIRESMDSFRHREDFVEWANETNLSFESFVDRLYNEDVKYVDIFLPLLKFVVSRFTDSPYLFYCVLGLIFGYFYSRNIWHLIQYSENKLNKYQVVFIFAFALMIAPWEINSFRFWLAAHLFVYCVFKILVLKQNKFILFLFITPFIHFGFLFSLLLFFAYKIIGNRIHIYMTILFFSLILGGINATIVKNLIPKTSFEVLDKKTNSYTEEGYIEERASGASTLNWYVIYKTKPLVYTTYLMLFLLYFKRKDEILKSNLLSYFCLGVFALSISYGLMQGVPTFGRYFRMSQLFIYGFFIMFLNQYNNDWIKKSISNFVIFFNFLFSY